MLLQMGMSGNNVSALQTALRNLGYGSVTIDGIFGPVTKQAVMDLQYLDGLTVTGVVDDATWGAIQTDLGTTIVNSGSNVYDPILTPSWNGTPIFIPSSTTSPGTVPTASNTSANQPMSTTMMFAMGALGLTLFMVARKQRYI